jgi:hypothetical protein
VLLSRLRCFWNAGGAWVLLSPWSFTGCPLSDSYSIEPNSSEAGPEGIDAAVVGEAGAPFSDAKDAAPGGDAKDEASGAADAQMQQPVELARNKSATASSEQTSRGNLAPLGNDGSASTRWSASGPETPIWWRVDLGATHRLARVEIDWEFARTYGYLIEISNDDVAYVTAIDRSASADTAQSQSASVNSSARYLRITVTAVTSVPISWASFWEVRVFGW